MYMFDKFNTYRCEPFRSIECISKSGVEASAKVNTILIIIIENSFQALISNQC